jgi:DNA-binding HxlR family transcriptional regulator
MSNEASSLHLTCPASQALSLVSRKWAGPLVSALSGGPLRHSALLRRHAGLSPKVMNEELRQLVRAGLVDRVEVGAKPIHVEYALTPSGQALHRALIPLDAWAEDLASVRR